MQPTVMSIILFSSLVIACSQSGMSQTGVEAFRDTEWVLLEINGNAVVDRVQSTLRFEGNDRIGGWGGCNRYFADIRSGRNFFRVGPIGSTRRICPPVVMEQEERFFNALQKSSGIRTQGDQLVIDSDATLKPLKFGRLEGSGS